LLLEGREDQLRVKKGRRHTDFTLEMTKALTMGSLVLGKRENTVKIRPDDVRQASLSSRPMFLSSSGSVFVSSKCFRRS